MTNKKLDSFNGLYVDPDGIVLSRWCFGF